MISDFREYDHPLKATCQEKKNLPFPQRGFFFQV